MEKSVAELRIAETPLAVFDLETTGRSSKYAEIVEASVVRIEPNRAPYVAFDSLIKPRGPVRCSEIHHIHRKDVEKAPSFTQAAPALAEALSGAVWVAYNVYFDLSFTVAHFAERLGIEVDPPYFCAANARSLLKLGKRAKLSKSCADFNLDFSDGQHIAIYDTWMTARLMRVWLDRMADLGLEHYGDLETLGTHKYLNSLRRPLWHAPAELRAKASESFRYQLSRYAQDVNEPTADPRDLPPLSDETPFIYGTVPQPSSSRTSGTLRGRLSKGIKTASSSPTISSQYESQESSVLKPRDDLFSRTVGLQSAPKDSSTDFSDQLVTPKETTLPPITSAQNHERDHKQVKLRPYQNEAITAILNARRRGVKRMVVCLPTGAGKTVIFSHLASIAQRRVLVLAHREELLSQAQEKLQRALGDRGLVDIEQAEQSASLSAKIVVASIRSLRSERLHRLISEESFGLMIYDECHHAVAQDNQRVLSELGVFEESFEGTLVGFTATTKRADGIGLDEVFEALVYSRNLQDMIRDQYLVPLRGYRISTSVSLEGMEGRGDFPIDELGERVDIQERNGLVARTIQELARDRRTICFCVTVRHAENLAQTLRECGVPAAMIYGEMKSPERARVLSDFRDGTLQVLTNVGVLTEGFDDPEVSCVAMARPTRSESMYIQCVGRGMRLFEGKKDCIILDFVDLSALNLITLPSLYGVPVDLDFEGREAGEASAAYHALLEDTPGFEWEAESLSLSELKERAQVFDPLRLKLASEIRAISQNGWVSLGQRGVALHFSRAPLRFNEFNVLLTGESGKRRYQVLLDGKEVAREALIERAVEAADYEIGLMGSHAVETASMYSAWREIAPPPELLQTLADYRLPRRPQNLEEAFRAMTFYHIYTGK